MADFDPALMQKVFHIPERKRIPNIKHHRQTDDLQAGLEIAKWAAFYHPETSGDPPALFNQVLSDSAYNTIQVSKPIGYVR